MLGFSMLKFVHRHARKLDRELKTSFVHLYRPFRWIPCFLHPPLEKILKKTKKQAVIIEFHDDEENFSSKATLATNLVNSHFRSKIHHHYPSVHCCSAALTPAAIEDLLDNHPAVKKIHTDRKVNALLNVARTSVKANSPALADLSGKGVTLAIIDTGIYSHRDLAGRIKAFKDFTRNKTSPYDDNGHGTHCAGDAAGDGSASNGKYMGMAPKADLIGVKVLNRIGSGQLSTVMAGVQWCIDHQSEYNIRIISMSLGSSATVPAAEDPMVAIVDKAWDAGIVVVVAAGNEGPDPRTISSPGISPKVITVGAMDDRNTGDRTDDQIADFSSRGPTIDGINKPDVLSPGVNIISLRSPNSYLDKFYRSSRVDQNYFELSGTSMATPICAGIIALMLEKNPDLTPDQVKNILLTTAEDRGLPATSQGKGYIDAEKAIRFA